MINSKFTNSFFDAIGFTTCITYSLLWKYYENIKLCLGKEFPNLKLKPVTVRYDMTHFILNLALGPLTK